MAEREPRPQRPACLAPDSPSAWPATHYDSPRAPERRRRRLAPASRLPREDRYDVLREAERTVPLREHLDARLRHEAGMLELRGERAVDGSHGPLVDRVGVHLEPAGVHHRLD